MKGVIGINIKRVSRLFEFMREHRCADCCVFHFVLQKLPEPIAVVEVLAEIRDIAFINDLFAVEKARYAQCILSS